MKKSGNSRDGQLKNKRKGNEKKKKKKKKNIY